MKEIITSLKNANIELDLAKATDFQKNITEFPVKNLIGVCYPISESDVSKVIELANELTFKLMPISSGRNWGLGSKLPITNDPTLIVDLRKMNRILEINRIHNYVVIEPGVTQEQVYQKLKEEGVNLCVNVTGSGKNTSIAGNLLDRGVGIHGQRTKDLNALEVILGNGKKIKTGFGHFNQISNDRRYHYQHGIGPDMTHLFTQSNYGIVTKLVVKLYPIAECTLLLYEVAEENLKEFVNKVAYLRQRSVVPDTFEINSQNDPRLFRLLESANYKKNQENCWFVWGALLGSKRLRNAIEKDLKEHFGKLCLNQFYFNSEEVPEEISEPLQVRFDRLKGIPGDHSLLTMAEVFNIKLDKTQDIDVDMHKEVPGFIAILPAVPSDGEMVIKTINLLKRISKNHDFKSTITFSLVQENVYEGFIRCYFDRNDPDQIKRAHHWSLEAHKELEKLDIYPYRVNNLDMDYFINRPEDEHCQTIRDIGKVMDPNNVIAPGKYCLNY
ncbi:MAG: 4-cresol dehydrogenase (hydroxylating) [Lentimonas sp.]|jgi:4-cresol dehydrogenase (hydroxylating)